MSDDERGGDTARLHAPVMTAEVLAALAPAPGALIVDCTLGLGGHAEAILATGARVLGLDRDAESLALARERLAGLAAAGRFHARQADYRTLVAVLASEGSGPVDGVLADLGVSSLQLTSPERGFSLAHDGPLDMRLDRGGEGPTAAHLIHELPEAELTRILFEYGEEPEARRIARAIVRRRAEAPFQTTLDLAAVVVGAKHKPRPGPPRHRIHPATLAFQALRIAVNDELRGLERFVEDAVRCLRRGGRLAVIAFHSLEDRPVKRTLVQLARGCVCPPDLPFCACGRQPQVQLVPRRALRPDEDECARNPRARSARLRAAVKLTDDVAPELLRRAA
jgi:16S rRNA (cytosine1402-N4)-methyltransferase